MSKLFLIPIATSLLLSISAYAQNNNNVTTSLETILDRCLERANSDATKIKACNDQYAQLNRTRADSVTGGCSGTNFNKELTEAKKDLCRACSELPGGSAACGGRGSSGGETATQVDRMLVTCGSRMSTINKCREKFDKSARTNSQAFAGMNFGNFSQFMQDPGDECGFMRGRGRANLEKDETKYDNSFKDNDTKRQDAEKAYFDTEKDMLEKASEIQTKMRDAQKEVTGSQRDLEKKLEKMQQDKVAKTQALQSQLASLASKENDLVNNAPQFIQQEFNNAKVLLEYSCMDKARAAVADREMKTAAKKANKQWKFKNLADALNGGVGYKSRLEEFGQSAYQSCMHGDKDFVSGFQKAAQTLQEKSISRQNALNEIEGAKKAINDQLTALANDDDIERKYALREAQDRWNDAQGAMTDLQTEFTRNMSQAATKQQKNSADINLYRNLAEADKRNLDATRASLKAAGNYEESDYRDTNRSAQDAAGAHASLQGVRDTIVQSCCPTDSSTPTGQWASFCREPSTGDRPVRPAPAGPAKQ